MVLENILFFESYLYNQSRQKIRSDEKPFCTCGKEKNMSTTSVMALTCQAIVHTIEQMVQTSESDKRRHRHRGIKWIRLAVPR